MSGRSAYVRAKNTERAHKNDHKLYGEDGQDDHNSYNYAGAAKSMSKPSISTNPSSVSSPRPVQRRRSFSSTSSNYGYPPPAVRKPRPIIVASAIEKSDFRTHLDGLSASVRDKLGRLLKGGDEKSSSNRGKMPMKSRGMSSDDDSRSFDFTPSINAVPPLSPSTYPEIPAPFPVAAPVRRPATPNGLRAKQQNEARIRTILRFEGGGKLPQLGWKSLSNVRSSSNKSSDESESNSTQNPELWDENGDTFVYMYMHGSRTKPPPSFRINSRVIEQSGSKIFTDMLFNPAEPEGWPRFQPSGEHDSPNNSMEEHHDPLDDFQTDPSMSGGRRSDSNDGESSLRRDNLQSDFKSRAPRGIQHEIYVPWPQSATGIHLTIWNITTRNFFAIMYDATSLVGTSLYDAITLLFQRISLYPDYLDCNISTVAWITDYIVRHKFDDVRNNPPHAASLLALSELPGIQWREGYIEAFVHCVGMLSIGLQTIPEWRYITPHTQMFLHNASMELEERINRAQIWLSSFDFTEMWPVTSAPPSSARGCFDRLRKWLCKYYESAFTHWPPINDETWLSRDVVIRLRNDFYGLYDYLVDREVAFDRTEGQKLSIKHKFSHKFRADSREIPLTDILIIFDDRNGFPHIPCPFPNTPAPMPVQTKPKSFILKNLKTSGDTTAQSRRKALSYAEASNFYNLRDQYMHTQLVINFIRFEQNDMLEHLDPYEARRGRWVLIYGVLQVLATISVDSPNLRYKDGAQYHLSPQMKGIVPWGDLNSVPEEQAEHTRSHCWVVPATWSSLAPKPPHGEYKPILCGQFGDGRIRAEVSDQARINSPKAVLTTPPNSAAGRRYEINIGRKRAEEWVQSTGVPSNSEASHGNLTGLEADHYGRGGSGGEALSGSIEGNSNDSAMQAQRRRRALLHGFTDFEPPKEW